VYPSDAGFKTWVTLAGAVYPLRTTSKIRYLTTHAEIKEYIAPKHLLAELGGLDNFDFEVEKLKRRGEGCILQPRLWVRRTEEGATDYYPPVKTAPDVPQQTQETKPLPDYLCSECASTPCRICQSFKNPAALLGNWQPLPINLNELYPPVRQ